YSEFSAHLFSEHFPKYRNKLIVFKMPIFNSLKIKTLPSVTEKAKRKIVFFGKFSPYKGLELFYKAAASLSAKYLDTTCIIAGIVIECYNAYLLEYNPLENIIIKDYLVGLKELYTIMNDAYLCVLPYIDATQSGVIMTSYAFNVALLVSD